MSNNNLLQKMIMRDPLEKSPGYLLRRASNLRAAELVQRLAKHDVRMVDATVLLLLGENPHITASAVGRMLDVQRANMVPLLKRLEDAGLIERAPIDGKSQGLSLTPAGEVRLKEVRGTVEQFENELMGRVPEELRAYVIPVLDALWR